MATQAPQFGSWTSPGQDLLWGWFVGVGAAAALLGLVAASETIFATIAATYFLAIIMAGSGGLHIRHGLGASHPVERARWIAGGLLTLGMTLAVAYDPLFLDHRLVIVLAGSLGAAGATRLLFAAGTRDLGWSWLFASGIFSIAAAACLAQVSRTDAMGQLASLLALDLLFQGLMLVMLDFSQRAAHAG